MAKLEQDIHQRKLDAAWEVWERMSLGDHPIGGVLPEDEVTSWVLVAVYSTQGEAIRFCNSCFTRSRDSAPRCAGDGFDAAGNEASTAALSE